MRSTTKRDGKEIFDLGYYNPITKETKFDVKNIIDNLKYGVQPTQTVKNLLIKAKIIEKTI